MCVEFEISRLKSRENSHLNAMRGANMESIERDFQEYDGKKAHKHLVEYLERQSENKVCSAHSWFYDYSAYAMR